MGGAGPRRDAGRHSTSPGRQRCPTEGTARPREPASGSRGARCSTGNWVCSNARFPVRRTQPRAASPDTGAVQPSRRVVPQKRPTPRDDRLSWQRLLTQRQLGNQRGEKEFQISQNNGWGCSPPARRYS